MPASLNDIHHWIQHGELAKARAAVEKLVDNGVERAEAANLASLCVRAGQPELGARVLHRIVRPPPRVVGDATAAERAEYAHCLIKSGAIDEGMALLEGIAASDCPAALLYRAAGLVARWNYRDTIPLLKEYVAHRDLSRYQRLVGQVNLAAALVFEEKTKPASAMLRDLLYVGSVEGYQLLLGRALELSAECLIVEKRWDKAEKFLDHAQKRLGETDGVDELFVKKFRAVVAVNRKKGDERSLEMLHGVREDARKRRHWETVRDCDRVEAIVTRNDRLLARVYFGTPHVAFRERLLAAYGAVPETLLDAYFWNARASDNFPAGHRGDLDLFSGELAKGGQGMKPGSLLHRLLAALLSDFYRPLRMIDIHSRIHDDVFYNPVTSRAAVHDALGRLRRWFDENDVPLEVVEKHGLYQLAASGRFTVRLAQDELLGKRYSLELRKLHAAWPSSPFSISQAVRALGLPRRTVLRVLQDAVDSRLLDRSGKARATRYLFSGKAA